MLFLTASKLQAQNLLYDGNFSLTTEIIPFNTPVPVPNVWCTWLNNDTGSDGSATVIAGECKYQIINPGINTWDVQLAQWGFSLVRGHAYRLSFKVKADADRSFGVFLGEDGGNWTNLIGGNYSQWATTNWETRSVDFNASQVFAFHKLSFELGGVNTTMYFDDIVLEDMGEYPMTIGIIGDATGGWDNDVFMNTTDRIHYTLTNYPLTTGWLRFRQDNVWGFHWGNNTFPEGFAYLWGPSIPINYGNYDISFNLETGEYSFVCVGSCPPVIGIIGSAVPPYNDWKTDIKMFTNDGVSYRMSNYMFVNGEAKFRQNNSWKINWGSSGFPTGTASLDGSNIPVIAGEYSVTFNILTGEYSFAFPSIGILGSSLNGWTEDIDMQTTDGINYVLLDYAFKEGEVKFRLDNLWDSNWGATDFPNGFAYMYGPNIPVPVGTYNVTFNRMTGEYTFTATTCPIAGIRCPDDIYLATEPGLCGANVNYPDVTATVNCGGEGVIIKQTEGLPSGSFFPTGLTTNTFLLTNAAGSTATCSFNVMINDFEPPVIKLTNEIFPPLWPANHKMVNVPINYKVSDNCGSVHSELFVYSNEPENGTGDGDLSPDWKIVDEHNVLLRAERSAKGPGREYSIYIVSHDDSWNYSSHQVVVTVPHDLGENKNSASNSENKNKSATIGESIGNVPLDAKVRPNPSAGNFNLDVKSLLYGNVMLSIFDSSGRLISNLNTNKSTFQFGEDLKSGIYLVIVRQGNHFNTIKIVKK